MPNSCSINRARRGVDHNSVAKPCSAGLSASQRPTIFSWVGVNFGGRPGTGCAAKPASPCWRKAATQRRTVRRSTPTKSATSSIEYPSSTRCTAKRRRYSKTAGEPSVLMADAIANCGPADITFLRAYIEPSSREVVVRAQAEVDDQPEERGAGGYRAPTTGGK